MSADPHAEQHRSRYRQSHGRARQGCAEHADHRRHFAAGARRRNVVSGRRKRIGQVGHVADGDGTAAKGRAGAYRRKHQAGRRGTSWRQRPAAAAIARHHHGDDLSGADDRAQSGGTGRPPDRRSTARPHRLRCAGAAQTDSGDDGAGAAARGRTHFRLLPASPLGRPAPAHHDRDGAGARSRNC